VLLTCEDRVCLGPDQREDGSTFLVKQRSGPYPALAVDGQGSSVVPNAGAVVLLRTAETVGLTAALSAAVAPWRRPLARHDPGKMLLDLAVNLAIGGDCLADLAQLRTAPQVFGQVASDPTISRLIDTLAADAPAALAAIATARATARARAWSLAGEHAPDHDTDASRPLVIDVDATLVTAHSEKESAAPTFKRGFGFHPLWAFCDHGAEGTGGRWRSDCGRATPGPTPWSTTSPCCVRRWPSCLAAGGRGITC
jgi:Transposase DDE domain group 1